MTIGVFVTLLFFVGCGVLIGFSLGLWFAERQAQASEAFNRRIMDPAPYDWAKDPEASGAGRA